MHLRILPISCQNSILHLIFTLKSEKSQSFFHFIGGRANKKQVLSEIIRNHDKQSVLLDRLHELVPCKDEVREYEEYRTQCEKAASLHKGEVEHSADQQCIDAYTVADDSFRSAWDYLDEDEYKQCNDHHQHQECHSLCLGSHLSVCFNLGQPPVDEVVSIEYMRYRKSTHLSEEIMA